MLRPAELNDSSILVEPPPSASPRFVEPTVLIIMSPTAIPGSAGIPCRQDRITLKRRQGCRCSQESPPVPVIMRMLSQSNVARLEKLPLSSLPLLPSVQIMRLNSKPENETCRQSQRRFRQPVLIRVHPCSSVVKMRCLDSTIQRSNDQRFNDSKIIEPTSPELSSPACRSVSAHRWRRR